MEPKHKASKQGAFRFLNGAIQYFLLD
jgi:hypothetical protein